MIIQLFLSPAASTGISLETWINLGTAAVTVVLAIATVSLARGTKKTVREMQLQREASYKPEIAIEIEPYTAVLLENKKSLAMHLYNIGLGAAKNVRVFIEPVVDFIDEVKTLRGTLNQIDGIIIQQNDENTITMGKIAEGSLICHIPFTKNELKYEKKITYILPDKPVELDLNPIYGNYFDMFASLALKGISLSNRIDFAKYLSLKIKLEYDDIAGDPQIRSMIFFSSGGVQVMSASPYLKVELRQQ